MKLALQFGLIALIALLVTVAPGGGATLRVLLTLLTLAFFAGIAFLGYRMYREHRFTLESLSDRQRLVLYGAIGLAFLTFTATPRLFATGGAGILAWIALLAACSYGVYWVFLQSRSY